MSELHDECGVFGIYKNNENMNIADETYLALYALQHRGQIGAGIAVNKDGNMKYFKGHGMIPEAIPEKELSRLGSGRIALGHVKYSAGGIAVGVGNSTMYPGFLDMPANADWPRIELVMRYIKGQLAICMNGSITNFSELREELNQGAAIFQSNGDTEVIAYVIARERIKTASIEDAVKNAVKKLKGAYAIALMSPSKLIGVRDPMGIRPLCYGKIGDSYVIASESCVFDSLGGEFIRDVKPGEMIVVDDEGLHSYQVMESHSIICR